MIIAWWTILISDGVYQWLETEHTTYICSYGLKDINHGIHVASYQKPFYMIEVILVSFSF